MCVRRVAKYVVVVHIWKHLCVFDFIHALAHEICAKAKKKMKRKIHKICDFYFVFPCQKSKRGALFVRFVFEIFVVYAL